MDVEQVAEPRINLLLLCLLLFIFGVLITFGNFEIKKYENICRTPSHIQTFVESVVDEEKVK